MSGKIAVFDSGYGGLTVLKSLESAMPCEDFVYYGDSINAPYGTRSDAELLRLNTDNINKLKSSYDIKCFVCGCNTTTSRVWNELCARFSDYHFLGISPAIEWAVAENPSKTILVLGTRATISSRKIRDRIERLKTRANIIPLAAQEIVSAVENQTTDTVKFMDYLEALLSPFRDDTDAVVLGCTHFPFVKTKLARCFKKKVRFYDAAVVTAAETRQLLDSNGLLNPEPGPGSIVFLNSDPARIPTEEKLYREYEGL